MSGEESALPTGWPGEVIQEGMLSHHLPPEAEGRTERQQARHGQGPADREHRSAFHNPAMAGNRTRSLLLLEHCIESGWLGVAPKPIYLCDALSATGIRWRRWLAELPPEMSSRLRITAADMNGEALAWAAANHDGPVDTWEDADGDGAGAGQVTLAHHDAKRVIASSGWHGVDIDPFGSPMPFLDAAVQSTARKAILMVTATDTAALAGSSPGPCLRRYGGRTRPDLYQHDSGLRLLLANIARCAARHDRCIEPLLSSGDSHHLRVSVRIRRSIEGANAVEDSLGWRIADPTPAELAAAVAAGLHAHGTAHPQPQCLVPLSHPVDGKDERVSGPLWVAPLADADALASMSEARALARAWREEHGEMARRATVRAVSGLTEEATCAHVSSLILTSTLPHYTDIGGPPPLAGFVEQLQAAGHAAAIARWGAPAIRTDAPWEAILAAAKAAHPPM